jgi:hypothetical protein
MRRVSVPNDILFSQVGEMVAGGADVTLSVKGNSMLPFIVSDRDSVVLSRVESEKLRLGDIILARIDDSRYVLHRVIRISGRDFYLCGDGNPRHMVEHCTADNVLARAVKVVRSGKTVSCDSLSERIIALLWRWLSPVRRYLLAVYRRMYKDNVK